MTSFWSHRFCDFKDEGDSELSACIQWALLKIPKVPRAGHLHWERPGWASLDINPRLSSSHLTLDEICQLVVNGSLHPEPSAQQWEMSDGIASCNSRARMQQTEHSYMNIMIPELCYLLGASVSISGYYSVLAGWHLWFPGFRLGFSVHLNQMSANKHLLC